MGGDILTCVWKGRKIRVQGVKGGVRSWQMKGVRGGEDRCVEENTITTEGRLV